MESILDDPRAAWLKEVHAETLKENPVARSLTVHTFVSRSKGLRNGKRRLRKHLKETYLKSIYKTGFQSWRRFPFDVYATEIINQQADRETLKEQILELYWTGKAEELAIKGREHEYKKGEGRNMADEKIYVESLGANDKGQPKFKKGQIVVMKSLKKQPPFRILEVIWEDGWN